MSNKEYPIGIFDSGIGGLTVLKEICRILPDENILYFGDTARVPYGIRSEETVTKYSFECIKFLLQKRIKLLVIACNTVSAVSLKEITKYVDVPVIGVIEPGAKAAVNFTKNKKIGVIGTEATIKAKAYSKAIKELSDKVEVYELACPLFVPLVEEGWTDDLVAKLIAERYLSNLRVKEIDTIVLGCTHYPLLKKVIGEVMGPINIVDSAIETSKIVREILLQKDLLNNQKNTPVRKYYVTDSPIKFKFLAEKFLNESINNIEKVMLS
ncbi:MAG: glutamate racemase [Thermodesulfovibrionales bacterium]|nr:glutamate racemase [Thermodesulfovibrionales bacterium]